MQTLGLCPASSGPISSAFLLVSLNLPVPGLIFLGCPIMLSQLLRSLFSGQGGLAPFQIGAGTGCASKALPACLLESKRGRCPGKVVVQGIPGAAKGML